MDQLADLSSTLAQNPPPPSKRSPAAADKGDDHHGRPSLASLPDLVLILLFQMLPVPDRGHLARTCSRLSTIMQCPSVWTDVTIRLHATITDKWIGVCFLGLRNNSMVRKYGPHFQRTTIICPCTRMSQEVCDMLSEFIQRGLKMKLVIKLGLSMPVVVDRFGHVLLSPFGPVHTVTDMVDAFRSSASISVDIAYHHTDLFAVAKEFFYHPKSARFFCMVNELSLPKLCEDEVMRGIHNLPTRPTALLISKCHALHRLRLSVCNVSEELLLVLSDSSGRRSPLRSLVLHHVDGRKSRTEAFPQLSSAAWRNLTSACPSLTVECYFACYHVPPLSQVIKPETPLVKLKVACYKYCATDRAQFAQVCREHRSTLQFHRLSAGIDLSIGRTQEYLARMGWNVLEMFHLCSVCGTTFAPPFSHNPPPTGIALLCLAGENSEFKTFCSLDWRGGGGAGKSRK